MSETLFSELADENIIFLTETRQNLKQGFSIKPFIVF